MVVGNGMLAQYFDSYKDNDEVVIFCSGVSNSNEVNDVAFSREKDLLISTVNTYKSRTVVYFSSCDVMYARNIDKAYYYHKLNMESVIQSSAEKYYIFRLPQVVGHSANNYSLINWFANSISNGDKINAWGGAYKNLIGIEEVFKLSSYFIDNKTFENNIINIVNSRYYSIKEIINTLEKIINKRALIEYIDYGFRPNYSQEILKNVTNKTKVVFDNQYLWKIMSLIYDRKSD
jgi:UDP-2-acetamido-2,6-beta-L-arabino-hexul-4-ose reductase